MARNFNLGAYLQVTYAPSLPVTMSFWFNADTLQDAAAFTIFSGSSDAHTIQVWGDSKVYGTSAETGAGSNLFSTSSNTYSTGTWNHAALTVASGGTARKVYLNGVAGSTSSGTRNPTIDKTNLGWGLSSQKLDGKVCEAAIYSVELSDAEIASLADGYSPLTVRPDALLNYWRVLGRTSPEQDIIGKNNMTVFSGTASPHARVLSPGRKRVLTGGVDTPTPTRNTLALLGVGR